jgi:tetratricopeptide (TPR) repeat protein
MKEMDEDDIIKDLIQISHKKQQIRETLSFTREAHKAYMDRRKRDNIRILAISLTSAAAIFLIGLVVLPSFFALDGAATFNSLYRKFDTEIATRGTGHTDQVSELISRYSTGQFNDALILADSLLISQPDRDELLLLKGLTEMELNQPDQAIQQFVKVIPRGGLYEVYSRWYLALIYLQQEKFSDCREQISILRKMDNHPYKNQIHTLYRKLRFRNN